MILLDKMMVLRIAGTIFSLLFILNLICHVSSIRAKGFPLGDFALVIVISIIVICRLQDIKGIARVVPDTMNLLMLQTQDKIDSARADIDHSREQINAVSGQLRDFVMDSMVDKMRYSPPEE